MSPREVWVIEAGGVPVSTALTRDTLEPKTGNVVRYVADSEAAQQALTRINSVGTAMEKLAASVVAQNADHYVHQAARATEQITEIRRLFREYIESEARPRSGAHIPEDWLHDPDFAWLALYGFFVDLDRAEGKDPPPDKRNGSPPLEAWVNGWRLAVIMRLTERWNAEAEQLKAAPVGMTPGEGFRVTADTLKRVAAELQAAIMAGLPIEVISISRREQE